MAVADNPHEYASRSPEGPAEYVEQLRAENRALRRGLIDEVQKRLELETALARRSARMLRRDHEAHD